jgi:nucleotide-binding universal stress UspA family protein
MHIVVATDGTLDPQTTAQFVAPHAEGSAVTVLTAVEIPRRLLAELRSVYGEHTSPVVDSDAEYVGISPQQPSVDFDFPGDDRIINLYLANQLEERTEPMVTALREAGMNVEVEILEGENGAKLILDYLRAEKADLVVMGTKGRGLFEGMIGSTGTKIVRHAPCSALLIRV